MDLLRNPILLSNLKSHLRPCKKNGNSLIIGHQEETTPLLRPSCFACDNQGPPKGDHHFLDLPQCQDPETLSVFMPPIVIMNSITVTASETETVTTT